MKKAITIINRSVNFAQYMQDAKKTESVIPGSHLYDPSRLIAGIELFVSASNILDQVKREIFYGKKNPEKSGQLLQVAKDAMAQWESNESKNPGNDLQALAHLSPLNCNTRVLHALLGLGTEGGEALDAFALSLKGAGLDWVNVAEEIGDLTWYMAIVIDELQADLKKILATNISKLKARFPDKFKGGNAIHRNIGKERAVLEHGLSSLGTPAAKPAAKNVLKKQAVLKNKKKKKN